MTGPGADGGAEHSYYYNVPTGFVVFNDQALGFDAVVDDDLHIVSASGSSVDACKSAVWSSDCEWFFVILANAIVLLNVYTKTGLYCRVKSARFIEMCLRSGILSQRTKGKKP